MKMPAQPLQLFCLTVLSVAMIVHVAIAQPATQPAAAEKKPAPATQVKPTKTTGDTPTVKATPTGATGGTPAVKATPTGATGTATTAPKSKALVPLRICTAQEGNNYHRYGQRLAANLKGDLDVVVVETKGSWENLELIDATPRRCDAVIAQEDAYALQQFERPSSGLTMDRTATLYPEYVHLLCPKNVKANTLSELDPEKHSVIVNQYGSGSYITWRLFRRLNPDYKRLKIHEKNLDEGILKLTDLATPACMFFVSGLGGRTLTTADQTFGAQLKLVSIDDPKLTRKVGREQRQIYRMSAIPGDIYRNLSKIPVTTPTVGAVFFTSPEWQARYPKASRRLASALIKVIAESRNQ